MPPKRKFDQRDLDIMARTLYGEAEANNAADAKAIAWVIVNRVDLPNWPASISQVCLQPFQFSCWNPGDPNRERILNAKSSWFNRCKEIALGVLNGETPDPTSRSTHYYATFVKTPKWAKGKRPVLRVNHGRKNAHLFFNDIDTPPPKSAKQALDQVKPVAASRTVVGSSVAGAATVASEVVTEVKDQVEPLAPYADSLRWLFLAVALIGIGVTIWARVSDRRKGIR